jgi:hypothetical protein
MQMDTVDQLLNLATKRLFLKITSMMEEVQANHAKIRPLQQASTTASFPCEWSSLLHTAYKRYCKWYNQPPPVNNSNNLPPGGPGGPGVLVLVVLVLVALVFPALPGSGPPLLNLAPPASNPPSITLHLRGSRENPTSAAYCRYPTFF